MKTINDYPAVSESERQYILNRLVEIGKLTRSEGFCEGEITIDCDVSTFFGGKKHVTVKLNSIFDLDNPSKLWKPEGQPILGVTLIEGKRTLSQIMLAKSVINAFYNSDQLDNKLRMKLEMLLNNRKIAFQDGKAVIVSNEHNTSKNSKAASENIVHLLLTYMYVRYPKLIDDVTIDIIEVKNDKGTVNDYGEIGVNIGDKNYDDMEFSKFWVNALLLDEANVFDQLIQAGVAKIVLFFTDNGEKCCDTFSLQRISDYNRTLRT